MSARDTEIIELEIGKVKFNFRAKLGHEMFVRMVASEVNETFKKVRSEENDTGRAFARTSLETAMKYATDDETLARATTELTTKVTDLTEHLDAALESPGIPPA